MAIDERMDLDALDVALRAFHKGPPGIVCRVARNDSTPPEYDRLPTTPNDEREDIARAINAYLDAAVGRA